MLDTRAVTWRSDEGTLDVGGVTFGLMGDGGPHGRLQLYKPTDMIDDYAPIIEEFRGGRVVELGIFRGGSTGFFALAMAPARLVAFELSSERVGLLDDVLTAKGLTDAVRLHYGVDQADRETVAATVDRELGGPIDLVIDDASHVYEPTVASFEVLFPRVRPGGLYIIEDWLPPTGFIDHFATIAAQRPSEASAAVEASIAAQLGDPTNGASRYFVEWFTRAALDPGSPHHAVVRRWYGAICSDDSPACRVLRECLSPRIDAGRDVARQVRTLTTMGTELVLALANGARSGIADVRITPFWIAIRRSPDPLVPGDLRYADVVYDHFGATGPLGA